MKILHIADLHINGGPETDEAVALSRAAQLAQERSVDLVVVAGDVFEGVSSPIQRLVWRAFLDTLESSGIYCVVIRGNHDRPLDLRSFRRSAAHCYVSEEPDEILLEIGGQKLRVLTLPHFSAASIAATETGQRDVDQIGTAAVVKILADYAQRVRSSEIPSILVAHGVVSGAALDSGRIPKNNGLHFPLESLKALDCPVMLGHYHKYQCVGGLVYYSGSTTRQTFGEAQDDKGGIIWTLDRIGWMVEFVSLSPRPHWLIDAHWDGVKWTNPDGEPLELLTQIGPETKIRFRYTVAESKAASVNLEPIREALGVAELHVERKLVIESAVRDARIMQAHSVEDSLRVWLEQKGVDVEEHLSLYREIKAAAEAAQ